MSQNLINSNNGHDVAWALVSFLSFVYALNVVYLVHHSASPRFRQIRALHKLRGELLRLPLRKDVHEHNLGAVSAHTTTRFGQACKGISTSSS